MKERIEMTEKTKTFTVTLAQIQYDTLVGVYLDAAFLKESWYLDSSSVKEMIEAGEWEKATDELDSIAYAANTGLLHLGLPAKLDRYAVAARFWAPEDALELITCPFYVAYYEGA